MLKSIGFHRYIVDLRRRSRGTFSNIKIDQQITPRSFYEIPNCFYTQSVSIKTVHTMKGYFGELCLSCIIGHLA